jgi:hypothetical protein
VAGNFIEQIKRAREADEGPAAEQEQAKPTEQMTDDELEEAITAKRRQLLDLQHQELRERELARVSPSVSSPASQGTTLQDVLREKHGKSRTWR